ncbi:MAG: class I SAM-dependent methyltransferase, partial [Dehalococcoidia bacterium]|nr:class I SAM-dependent methyltransferase [Dehalococcoidia bacterium]
MLELPLTAFERRWREIAPPRATDSAQAIYDLLPALTSAATPFVSSTAPYDPQSEWHWSQAARVADYAARAPAGARVAVDVGPGDGWPALPLARECPSLLVLGVEPSPQRTRVCAGHARLQRCANAVFVTADAAHLPLRDGAVDYVVASQSLEEASDPEAVLRELARVLRRGGVLRASYQDWRLPALELESVGLLEGRDALLCIYARRVRDPALERRYVIAIPSDGAAADAFNAALVAASAEPRTYGETALRAGSPLRALLLERVLPHARRSMVVELRRWTTPWLVGALRRAGFAQA